MKKIVLYGNSLAISSIGAGLQGSPEFQVLPVDPCMPDVQSHLISLQPDAVILDMTAIQPNFAIALWKERPQLLLIGLDIMNGKALVLSHQPALVLTTDDLVQLLRDNRSSSKIIGEADREPEK